MPTVSELYDAGQLNVYQGKFNSRKSTASKVFVVSGAANECEAVAAAYRDAPASIRDNNGRAAIPKRTAQITERRGDKNWVVTVEYSYDTTTSQTSDEESAENLSSGGVAEESPEVCFQCSATSTTVLRPVRQWLVYKTDDSILGRVDHVPIGWNGSFTNFSASGVDIPVTDLREQYTKIMRYSTVRSAAWRRKIALCRGKVNSGAFKGWQPGEVMFDGCSYQTPQDSTSKVKVTFEFTIRLNEENASVAGINIGHVNGHDYIWAVQDNNAMNFAAGVTGQIKYVFVSQLFEYIDFDILGV